MKERKRLYTLLFYWVCANLVPAFLVWDACADRLVCPLRRSPGEAWLLGLYVVAAFGVETILLHAFAFALQSAAKSGRRILAAAGWLLVAAYLTLLAGSCLVYLMRGSFLNRDELSLTSFFLDPFTLLTTLTQRDLLAIVAALAAGMFLTAGWLWAGTVSRNRKPLVSSRRGFWTVAAAVIALGLVPRFVLVKERIVALRDLGGHFATPQMSLLWAPVFFGAAQPTFERVELDLAKRPHHPEPAKEHGGRRPNILLIIVEAMRGDVLERSPSAMPAVAELARGGISFRHAYCTAPETGASFFSMITGMYPLLRETRSNGYEPGLRFERVYDLLTASGYRSAYFTWEWLGERTLSESPSLEIHQDPRVDGEEQIKKALPREFLDANMISKTLVTSGDKYNNESLKRWVARDERPFFGMIYFFSSHFLYVTANGAPRPFAPNLLPSVPSFLWYPPEIAPILWNRYLNSLHYLDSLIRETVEFLSNSGRGDTVVIVTGDHGELFHEHGQVTHAGFLYEEAIRVPLVISYVPAGMCTADVSAPVSLIDLAPTILSLAGLPQTSAFQGETLVSREYCQTPREAAPVFSSIQVNTKEDAVIAWPWKYTRNFSGHPDRLYRLDVDPGESRELSESEPERAAELKEKLSALRNRQLTYHSSPELRKNYYPPGLPR